MQSDRCMSVRVCVCWYFPSFNSIFREQQALTVLKQLHTVHSYSLKAF